MVNDAPLISVLTPHWNRPNHLRDFLEAMAEQDYPNFEVLVHDDGSDEPMATWAHDAFTALGPAAHVASYHMHERRRRPDDPEGHPGYPQWSKQYNKMFPSSKGDIVGILSSDWMPKPNFLSTVAENLVELGPGNMIFGDVPEQKATKIFIPPGSTSGRYRVKNSYCADTRNQNFIWREDWRPWDETFDLYGFGHAMPFWLGSLFTKGVHFWVSLDVHADENTHDNPEEFSDQIKASSSYYDMRCKELVVEITGAR
jgi:hypothetical protein